VRYVAFLRGINVGGHKPVKMADLRTMFVALGFQNVNNFGPVTNWKGQLVVR